MSDIFSWIKQQEAAYAQEIEVAENWSWCMKDHIRTSMLFKHGKFITASNDLKTKNPFNNKVYPLLNLRYRAEDIDMKDVVLYVDDPEYNHLSFLVKKYHDEVYVREHDLDSFFDEAKEEKIDFGGTLVRKSKDGPVIEPLESIAFCDQTDILSGPIGFKSHYSPSEILDAAKLGWGSETNGADITLDDLVMMADFAKEQDPNRTKTQTPGKYIEVYRVHGSMPASWLSGRYEIDESKEKFVRQIQIVAFYETKSGRQGVTLYKAKEFESPFKLHLTGKKIRNRALTMGGVEELFEVTIWTNYSEIRKRDMLDAASKTILQTSDEGYANRNKIKDMDNLEITVVKDGANISQVPTASPNIQLFTQWIEEWNRTAQVTSGATDALLGETPPSGTPFALENLVARQGQQLHSYRRGKFATFIAEIYTDWIIPDIQKELLNGVTFLATLTQDEMEYVADCLVRNKLGKYQIDKIFSGEVVTPEELQVLEDQIRSEFARGGNKKFVEILAGEFKDLPLKVKVNVANKQKDMVSVVDKLSRVFQVVMARPEILQDPKTAKVFSKILEYSGLDPIDFGYAKDNKQEQPQPEQPQTAPQPSQYTQPQIPA